MFVQSSATNPPFGPAVNSETDRLPKTNYQASFWQTDNAAVTTAAAIGQESWNESRRKNIKYW